MRPRVASLRARAAGRPRSPAALHGKSRDVTDRGLASPSRRFNLDSGGVADSDQARGQTAVQVVGYTRVSTEDQAQNGYGLDVQERQVRAWCREHGHRLRRVYRDEGVSGTLADRDGLADALDALGTGGARGMVVPRLDRLARDLLIQEALMGEVWRSGAEILSTASGEQNLRDDPDDPSRKLIRRLLGAVSEWEREMLVLRMKRGRRRKHERGGYAYGSPPYGYTAEHGVLAQHPAEQKALRRMADLREGGCSTREIAAALAAEGHPTKRGGRWTSPVVARILARQAVA